MKSCEVKFNEALATLKAKASASKYKEVVEKYSTLPTIEAKLNCVEAAIADAVKESSPLGVSESDIEEAKRDYPLLFGVEPRTAPTNKESKPTITKHNGSAENFVEGSPLNEGRSTPITKTNTRKDIFAKGDALMVEADFKRGKITAEQRRVLLGLPPAEYANLTESRKKEFDLARTFGFSESDALKLARL